MKNEKEFWDLVDIKDANECWPWKGSKSKKGYGNPIKINEFLAQPHRHAYMFHYKITKLHTKQHVYHHCDVPTCVNPNHLFLGTHTDNMRDKRIKERGNTTKLTASDIERILKLRKERKTQQYIADKFNIRRSTLCSILHGKGWTHITKGQKINIDLNKKLTNDNISKIIELRKSGQTLKVIAKKFNMSIGRISTICRKHNIKVNCSLTINDEQVKQIRLLKGTGLTQKQVAEQFGTTRALICSIWLNKTRKNA